MPTPSSRRPTVTVPGATDCAAPLVAAVPVATSVEAVRSLARTARLLERASGDLGLAHYRVLSAIAAGDDRASRVAERFELGRPTISAAVDALCRAGLIERTVVATDQRGFALRLTERGRDTLASVETTMVDVVEDLCRRLPSPSAVVTAVAALGGALDARGRERHPPHPHEPRTSAPRGAPPTT
jgi:DNA-binding MarR family transcriptional regulator